MEVPSKGFGYGDVAVRVEPGFGVVDFKVVAMSVLEEVAVEVDPRVSLPCAAWKRETFVFEGATVDCGGGEAELTARSRAGPGVGGGEMKATFLWTSVLVEWLVLTLPLLVFRELRPLES